MNEKQVCDRSEISARIRAVRTTLGMNQQEAAAAAGINQKTLSQWELGDVPESIPAFGLLAISLGETPDALLLTTKKENELAQERNTLPTSAIDDMMALTRVLITMHRKAESQGPGISPITLFRQHADSINSRLLGRKQPAGPADELQRSSAPLDQQIEDLLARMVNLTRSLPVDSGHGAALARAAHELGRSLGVESPLPPPDTESAGGAGGAKVESAAKGSARPRQDRKKNRGRS